MEKKRKLYLSEKWFNNNGCRECDKKSDCEVLLAAYKQKVKDEREQPPKRKRSA